MIFTLSVAAYATYAMPIFLMPPVFCLSCCRYAADALRHFCYADYALHDAATPLAYFDTPAAGYAAARRRRGTYVYATMFAALLPCRA